MVRSVSSDGCVYELEWYTAAACVLSRTQGDDCKVEDAEAGGFTHTRKKHLHRHARTHTHTEEHAYSEIHM